MSKNKNLEFRSKCVHAGINEYEFGPVVPPIYQTSTFKFKSTEHGSSLFKGEGDGYIYTRMGNPTIEAMENAIAELEGGHKALGCASGMAAIHTALTSLLQSGDHVVCSEAVYGPTSTLLKTVLNKFRVESTFVNTDNLEETKNAIKSNTKIVYVETPGNPTLFITDLVETAKLAHEAGAKLVVDNTFMSPALQRPLELGSDIVVHSMTKFLNGHADVVGGVIIVNDEATYKHFRKTLNQLGGVIDPFNAFLVHRGLKTLSLRMEQHSKTGQEIAEWLHKQPKIEWVSYPGLVDHPQHRLARKQHDKQGGMISFGVRGGFSAGETLMNSVELCQLAVSLGGVETLVQHPASMTHASMGKEARQEAGISDGLIRLSVGIESSKDIIADLQHALSNT